MTLFALREAPLSADEAIGAVTRPGAGGIALFLGTVRDSSSAGPITLLEYEAYGSMALKEMQRIAEEISNNLPGVTLCVLHRVGALRVGELAVVCAASAPHRAEAFAACRSLIDQIKQRVPIWKREHGPLGPYWVGWADARSPATPASGEPEPPA